jgi:hypothetical protein
MRFLFVGLNGIIVDYGWYADRVLEIDSWSLKTFGYQPRDGMSLTFQEESHKIWFLLRWNGE